MLEQKKLNNKQGFVYILVILFLVVSSTLLITSVMNNSQAEWAIVPDIRLVGEYKIGDGEWKPIVEGEHISATKGDVMLKGVLKICDPETNDFFGTVTNGSLMYFTFNHINLSLTENNQITMVYDIENPLIGEDACGHNSVVAEYNGENGYFEGVIRNYHRFGNETAVDEFLSSMKLYASDYSEKTALRSGNSERVVAIMIIISALLVLGIAIFSYLLDKSAFKNYLFSGLLILSAGFFFLFTSKAIYLWSDLMIVNTVLKGISAMAYLLFAFVLGKDLFSGKTESKRKKKRTNNNDHCLRANINRCTFHPRKDGDYSGFVFSEERHQTAFLQFGYRFRGKYAGVQRDAIPWLWVSNRGESIPVGTRFSFESLVCYTFCDR